MTKIIAGKTGMLFCRAVKRHGEKPPGFSPLLHHYYSIAEQNENNKIQTEIIRIRKAVDAGTREENAISAGHRSLK